MFCFFSFSRLPALKPSRGDRVDVDRCVNEQHDGENIRSLLHCPHVGCEGAGQYSRGIAWKGKNAHSLTHTLKHEKTRPLTAKIFMRTFGHSFIFLFLCSLPSPHQVNKYAKELLAAMSSGMEEKDDPGKLTAESFPVVWLSWFIAVIPKAYSLLALFFLHHSHSY